MDEKIAQQVLEELFPPLESLETQCAPILKFLKDKGIASDEELAPYFQEAGNASNVRWRAARLRMTSMISAAARDAQRNAESAAAQKQDEPAKDSSAATQKQPEASQGHE